MTTSVGSPCRVLVLNERDLKHPKAGGAETHVSEIFGRLARRGYEVTQLASGWKGAATRERVDDVDVCRLGPLPAYYPRAFLRTLRGTRAGAFDVVVECLNKVPFYSPVYSSAPVLALVHHLFGEVAFRQVPWPVAAAVWTSERLIPSLYASCPFVAISESTRADLIARGLPGERILVSHPGIHPPKLSGDVLASVGTGVVFLGRLEAYKKIDVLLRAMAKLADRFPHTPITIMGRGPAENALRVLAKELGLSDRLHLTGYVSIEERDLRLAEARVCVCPSEKEGWGLTVIESNAAGTPVVATDADGLRDSVRHGETGFLVADGDVDGFASRIGELLADDALAATMSQAALEWSKHFDWERAADDIAGAIEIARSSG